MCVRVLKLRGCSLSRHILFSTCFINAHLLPALKSHPHHHILCSIAVEVNEIDVEVNGGQTFSASAATGSSWFCLIWSNISAVFFGLRIHIMRSEGKWRERSVSLDWMLPCAISELMLETG